MNWIQRKIYLYNVTFGLYMLDWWERYLFNTLVIVLMWFICYNTSKYVTDFCKSLLVDAAITLMRKPGYVFLVHVLAFFNKLYAFRTLYFATLWNKFQSLALYLRLALETDTFRTLTASLALSGSFSSTLFSGICEKFGGTSMEQSL